MMPGLCVFPRFYVYVSHTIIRLLSCPILETHIKTPVNRRASLQLLLPNVINIEPASMAAAAAAAAIEVVVTAVGYKNSRSHADPLDDTLGCDKRSTSRLTCCLAPVTAPGALSVAIFALF